MAIDVEWALGELSTFVEMTTLLPMPKVSFNTSVRQQTSYGHTGARSGAGGRADSRSSSARLAAVHSCRHVPSLGKHRQAAQRAIVQLTRQSELEEKLGENAPRMDAAKLHAWVWDGARWLWQSGHLREAVTAAAIVVNAQTQTKLRCPRCVGDNAAWGAGPADR